MSLGDPPPAPDSGNSNCRSRGIVIVAEHTRLKTGLRPTDRPLQIRVGAGFGILLLCIFLAVQVFWGSDSSEVAGAKEEVSIPVPVEPIDDVLHATAVPVSTELADTLDSSVPPNAPMASQGDNGVVQTPLEPPSLGEIESFVLSEISKVDYQYPSVVSRYDLSTTDDIYYAHLVNRFTTSGEKYADWPLFKSIHKELGRTIGDLLDAQAITHTINTAMPVTGQEPIREIEEMVEDCCRILHVRMPKAIAIRPDPHYNAYAIGAGREYKLVLTSGLLDLFGARHDELRFVIGHELGHAKCQHMRLKVVGSAVLKILEAFPVVDPSVLPTLGLGCLLSWSREAEIAADRAGLLCCQDLELAQQAIIRLHCGIPRDSTWVNPETPDFDADKVIADFRAWENQPFVTS